MEHSNLGLRRDGASINEGKDPERVGHLEQSADQDWDDLVAMLNPAYMVGQLERGGRQGRSIGSSLSVAEPRSFAAIKKDLPLAHFEEVRSWAAAVTYCQKADTRLRTLEFGIGLRGGSGKA